MNPLVILKGAACHAGLEEFRKWLEGRKTWELWGMLTALTVMDGAMMFVDIISLVDDALVGVPAFFIALELKRRWKAELAPFASPSAEEVRDGEEAAGTPTG